MDMLKGVRLGLVIFQVVFYFFNGFDN